MEQPLTGRRALLLAGPVFFAAMIVTELGWQDVAYSWVQNNISDLGNVTCGLWDEARPRMVCSPLHAVFNIGAVLTGLLLAAGILAMGAVAGRIVRGLALLSAIGFVLVGVFPADVHDSLHWAGALMIFFAGNAAIFWYGLRRPGLLPRWQSLALGAAGLLGGALFVREIDPGIGLGTVERFAVFPILFWAFLVALRMAKSPVRRGRHAAGSLPSPHVHVEAQRSPYGAGPPDRPVAATRQPQPR